MEIVTLQQVTQKEYLDKQIEEVSGSGGWSRSDFILHLAKEAVEASPKDQYNADMVAMLTELQLEIEEKFNDRPFSYNHHQRTELYRDIDEIIQQKINSLKEDSDVC